MIKSLAALLPGLDRTSFRHAAKTSLAAVLTWRLTLALGLPEGLWAVISVIIVMQANLGGSLTASWSRLLGTAVGAALGGLCAAFLGAGMLSLGVGTFVTMLLCASLPFLSESSRIAGVTAAVIILMSGQGGRGGTANAVLLGWERFLEIAVGIGVGLAVSVLVWPSRAKTSLARGVAAVLDDSAAFYEAVVKGRLESRSALTAEESLKAGLRLSRARNRVLLKDARREPAGLSDAEHVLISLLNFEDRIFGDIVAMELAAHGPEPETYHENLREEITRLAQATTEAMRALAKDIAENRPPAPKTEQRHALDQALDSMRDKQAHLRETKITVGYDLDEVIRFFSFAFAMRSLAEEVLGMMVRYGEMWE